MYQYTESGLRNVWLRNGYTLSDTPYGPAVEVQNLHGLIRAIVSALVQKTSTLTSPEIRYLRHYLDLSQKDFAKFVGVQEQTVSLWERSKQRIPKSADIVLRALVAEALSGGKLQFRELLDAITRSEVAKTDRFTFETKKHKNWLMAA
jgi:putative transcriptional regulator